MSYLLCFYHVDVSHQVAVTSCYRTGISKTGPQNIRKFAHPKPFARLSKLGLVSTQHASNKAFPYSLVALHFPPSQCCKNSSCCLWMEKGFNKPNIVRGWGQEECCLRWNRAIDKFTLYIRMLYFNMNMCHWNLKESKERVVSDTISIKISS